LSSSFLIIFQIISNTTLTSPLGFDEHEFLIYTTFKILQINFECFFAFSFEPRIRSEARKDINLNPIFNFANRFLNFSAIFFSTPAPAFHCRFGQHLRFIGERLRYLAFYVLQIAFQTIFKNLSSTSTFRSFELNLE